MKSKMRKQVKKQKKKSLTCLERFISSVTTKKYNLANKYLTEEIESRLKARISANI